MRDLIGSEIAGCEVIELLGRGAMGAVYRAHQKKLGRFVAIKVLERKELAGTEDEAVMVRRFEQEAQAVAALNHPNVMAVYDYGEEGDLVYMVVELVSGRSIGEHLELGRSFSASETMSLGAQAAHGLAAAHRAGLVHRDVKPDNLLLTDDDVVKVADFGLAKQVAGDIHLTHSQTVVGSPVYMSPEQCQGESLTQATDVYSLGVSLYCMLVGHAPFDATSAVGVMMKHVGESVVYSAELRRSCPRDLLAILDRAMSKSPEDRWPCMTELADALERVEGGGKLTDLEKPNSGEFAAPIRINTAAKVNVSRPALLAGAAVVLLLVVAGIFALNRGGGPGPGEETAQTPELPEVTDAGAGLAKTPPHADARVPDGSRSAAGDSLPPAAPTSDPAVVARQQAKGYVLDAMELESAGELTRAREILEQVEALGQLEEISSEGAKLLENLRDHEKHLELAKQGLATGDLDGAGAAAVAAHALYRTLETAQLTTRVQVVRRQLEDIAASVRRDELEAARQSLVSASLGEDAACFVDLGKRIDEYTQLCSVVIEAWESREWEAAREPLEMANQALSTPWVEKRLAALDTHASSLERGAKAREAGDLDAARVAFEEALAAIPSDVARTELDQARFDLAVRGYETAEAPSERLALLREALSIRQDAELAQAAEELRRQIEPTDEERVRDALELVESLEQQGDHRSALHALEGVSEFLTAVDQDLRARHAAALTRVRAALQPARPRWESIPRANSLFETAEKSRKTPLTLFSDRNERRALAAYEQLLRDYPTSDKVPEAYYGAAHVAENLDQARVAIGYWQKAVEAGYPDPVDCYMLAADTAKDDLGDISLARSLYNQALRVCNDDRRKDILRELK